jgi:hypothetical protein
MGELLGNFVREQDGSWVCVRPVEACYRRRSR